MSVFAASSWAAVAAVAHQLERESAGLDPPLASTLRGFARRLHAARLLARHVFTAADPPRCEAPPPLRDTAPPPARPARPSALQDDDTCG